MPFLSVSIVFLIIMLFIYYACTFVFTLSLLQYCTVGVEHNISYS